MTEKQSLEDRFNAQIRDLIKSMKKLAEGAADTSELYLLEKKYKLVAGLDKHLLLIEINNQQFFDTYHAMIVGRNEDFFMTTDFTGRLQRYEKVAGYTRNSSSEWLRIIEILRRVWKGADDTSRETLWENVMDLYMTYLEYRAQLTGGKK